MPKKQNQLKRKHSYIYRKRKLRHPTWWFCIKIIFSSFDIRMMIVNVRGEWEKKKTTTENDYIQQQISYD